MVGSGKRQPRNGERIAGIHRASLAQVRRDSALAGHIMPAAGQANAQVLVKRRADELSEIEAGEGEGGQFL